MELTEQEIRKISRKFNINEKDIIGFLADEEHAAQIYHLKESFMRENDEKVRIKILTDWRSQCKKYSDFEDLYIIIPGEFVDEQFFLDWLKVGTDYRERRNVYQCAVGNENLRQRLIGAWIEIASDLEDIREAMSYVGQDTKEYKTGLKKITNIYKN
jgi:hypothetical protein